MECKRILFHSPPAGIVRGVVSLEEGLENGFGGDGVLSSHGSCPGGVFQHAEPAAEGTRLFLRRIVFDLLDVDWDGSAWIDRSAQRKLHQNQQAGLSFLW